MIAPPHLAINTFIATIDTVAVFQTIAPYERDRAASPKENRFFIKLHLHLLIAPNKTSNWISVWGQISPYRPSTHPTITTLPLSPLQQ